MLSSRQKTIIYAKNKIRPESAMVVVTWHSGASKKSSLRFSSKYSPRGASIHSIPIRRTI